MCVHSCGSAKALPASAGRHKGMFRLHLVAAGKLRKGVGCGLFEAGQAAAEDELHFVGRAVTLLGDENVGQIALFGRGVQIEKVRAVDEHHDVGILFDSAGFAQVGKLRAAFVALRSTGELTEDKHGNLEFLGEAFEAARDAGYFFLAGIETAATGEQLEVVNDQERKAFVALEAASFGTNLKNAGRAGVVDPQGRTRNGTERLGHTTPVFAAEMAGAEFVCIDLCDRGDETLQQRFLGHFEAEYGHRQAAADGNVFGQVQCESGFSLRRTSSENNQFRRLQSGKQLVELAITGGNASNALAFTEDPFEAVEAFVDDLFDGDETGLHAIFGQGENAGFGVVEDGVGAVFAFEGALLNVVCGVDQVAEDGLFFDDAGVVLDVGYARHAIDQRGQIRRATGGIEFAPAVQFLGEGDQIDGLLRLTERDHLLEDVTVLREEEILDLEGLDGGVEGVIVDKDSPEYGAFGIEIIREGAFESGFRGHNAQKSAWLDSLFFLCTFVINSTFPG